MQKQFTYKYVNYAPMLISYFSTTQFWYKV